MQTGGKHAILVTSGSKHGGTKGIAEEVNCAGTARGTIMGTLSYMSPEQWGIGVEIDHLTDIWACGILLHRMICGRHPLYPRDGSDLVVTAMLDLPMPSMAEAAPADVPRELIQIVDRCLQKHKAARWPSADELLAALEPFLPGRRSQALHVDESPYAGLSPFQESDAGKFFGRSREIVAMVTRLHDRPLLTVVGSSGVGKSSFVRAGVVPALKRSGEAWETQVLRPGRRPLEALASILAPMITTATSLADEVNEQHQLVETLRREPGHLGAVLRLRARRDNRRILLFVDQFEELYTQAGDPAECAAFTACLAAVADDATSPLRVVLSLRSDFLDRVAEDPALAGELTQGLFFLGPPGREGLRDRSPSPPSWPGSSSSWPRPSRTCSTIWRPRPTRCRSCSSPPPSCGSRATSRAGCSPTTPTPRWAGSPGRSPATPTASSPSSARRRRRWSAPCCSGWSPPSAPARSSRSPSSASCRARWTRSSARRFNRIKKDHY